MKYDDQCLCQKLHSHSMLHSLIHRQLEARLSAARRSADQNTVYTNHSRLLLPAFIHTQHIHRQTHSTFTQADIARHTAHSDTDADRQSETDRTLTCINRMFAVDVNKSINTVSTDRTRSMQ